MILHYVNKNDLRSHWDFVKNGIEIIRSKGHTSWIAEDIYCDCHENRAMLFIGIKDNKEIGFAVLQPIGDALHVWAAWCTANDEDLFYMAWNEIQQIAKNGGKTKVTFSSQRRGWDRKAKELGFKPSTWEFTL